MVLWMSWATSTALALARQQEELLGSDPETLRRLIGLARAAGNRAEAERYAKRLLQLSLLQQWQVQVTPTVALVKNGRLIHSTSGVSSYWGLRSRIWLADQWH